MPEGERQTRATNASARRSVGIVLERRRSASPWLDHSWRAVGLLPAAGPGWRRLAGGADWQRYYAGALPLTLFAAETEGYGHNLMAETPKVFVVLRGRRADAAGDARSDHGGDSGGDDAPEVEPFLVTVCPFEAQDYLDSGETPVEALPMPPELRSWVQSFVDRHHVATPLKKRRRRSRADDEVSDRFARRPVGDR